ncbi:NAD(P)/FAD-dependent oxidoreductase [Natronolimnohabitans innermongolicus]|uniref:FAD dependent oxidoreductase n=1 Tax=Natronolimnohabitans innermongolicus JCM 12255 TaxID=1227499 RepID=L9XIV3_9EURY|nr:NAD(P)-binding protein [Natronolimnohabitans innermongolicus]ELY61645.1 FAD dependent oxidoreductase [Natronolimnohabitans innermongolicus JCM 12255]
MIRIGIVGAGAGAAAAAYRLERADRETACTVLEKSSGLCGRAATRRRNGATYDYGANYVKSADDRVAELLTERLETDGLVDVAEPIWTFDEAGDVSEGRDADEHKWTYESGLTQLAKRLFARTDATVHRETRVETLRRDEASETNAWHLEDADGTEWGPFDVLVLNPPAPQTAELVRTVEWDHAARTPLLEAVDDVPYRTIWTGVLHYPFELEVPYYALVNTDKDHEIGWISREECKSDHVPDGESLLIVQANHDWSVERYDDDPETNLETLADLAADVIGDDRLRDPDWTDHQGWRYAQPEAEVATEPLERAEREGLYCLGDWVAGEGRVHAALRCGLEVGDRIALESV